MWQILHQITIDARTDFLHKDGDHTGEVIFCLRSLLLLGLPWSSLSRGLWTASSSSLLLLLLLLFTGFRVALVTGINLKNKTNIIVHVGGRSLKNSLYVLADNLMRFSGLHSKQGRDHFWARKHICCWLTLISEQTIIHHGKAMTTLRRFPLLGR